MHRFIEEVSHQVDRGDRLRSIFKREPVHFSGNGIITDTTAVMISDDAADPDTAVVSS